jgi:serine/threonine protein kinase
MNIAKPSLSSAPADVFISYSSRDADRVVPLVRLIEAAGISVWRDGDRILGGEYYGEAIAEAINQSKVLLLMCSQAAFDSDNVAQEIRTTWDFGHHNVLPLLLEPGLKIPIKFQYCLAGKQWIDIVNQPDRWLGILIAALERKGVHPRGYESSNQQGPVGSAATPPEVPLVRSVQAEARGGEAAVATPNAGASGGLAQGAGRDALPIEDQPAPHVLKDAKASSAHAKSGEQLAGVSGSDSRVSDSTDPREPGKKGFRFRIGDRPIAGVDLELVEPLGLGGFGEVWKAINPLVPNMQPVALKFCLDPEAQQFLRHEAATVAQVLRHGQRHEGIVSLLHTYLSADPPALEYEFVSGGNLADYIRSAAPGTGTLPLSNVTKVIKRLTEIIAFAHQADPPIVHRDLKPANILVERRGTKSILRIADFGIGGVAASCIISQTTGSGKNDHLAAMLKGAHTPLYASPQQIAGRRADPRDDVHALGVIWYQLLVGDLTTGAPSGSKWAHPLLKRGMRPEVIDILNACFESRAEDRPADARFLLKRLQAVAQAKSGGDSAVRESDVDTSSGEASRPTSSSGSVPLGPPPDKRSDSHSNRQRTSGTAQVLSDSTRRGGDSGAYPRIDDEGNTLLKCDCGKLLKIPSADSEKPYSCPICGATHTAYASWALPVKEEAGIPDVLPAHSKGGSPVLPLQWDKLLQNRAPVSPQGNERAGPLRRLVAFLRSGSKRRLTSILIVLGLLVLGVAVIAVLVILGSSDKSFFK